MTSNNNHKKLAKTPHRRLKDLENHLFFLKKDLQEFKNEPYLYKRIAAELRLLICKMNRNKPLLIDLIKEFGDPQIYNVNSKNRVTEKITVTNILDYPEKWSGFFYKGRKYSVQDLIVIIASQDGSGHEDTLLDEGIASNESIFIGGIGNPNLFLLNQIGTNVFRMGLQFLKDLKEKGEYNITRDFE